MSEAMKEAPPETAQALRIVSLCCVFPTADDPQRGVFVRARLAALARQADLRVVAPIGLVRWGVAGPRRFGRRHPQQGPDRGLTVRYPRWLYPPSSGWLNGILLFLQLLPAFVRLRRERGWDLLDAHFGHPEGVAAALLATVFRCPFTVTLRGNELEHARSGLRRKLLGWALRRSRRVFAVSKELQDLACELGVPPGRTTWSPNGVDIARFRYTGRADARDRLGLDPDLVIVLSVASLIPRKRTLDVLDAFARLVPDFPGLRLVLAGEAGVGEGAYAREVRARCEIPPWQGNVTLLGAVPQDTLEEWLNAADLLCLASVREGCPNAVLEALACGLPVVANRVGAVPDLLPSADYGVMTEPRNPALLADALREALNRSWDRPAIAAWGRSRDWDRVAADLLPLYEDAAGMAGAKTPVQGHGSDWTSR